MFVINELFLIIWYTPTNGGWCLHPIWVLTLSVMTAELKGTVKLVCRYVLMRWRLQVLTICHTASVFCLWIKCVQHALSCLSREHLKLLLLSLSCAFCYHAINCTHCQRTCGYCTVPYVLHTSLLFRTEPYFWWISMLSKFCHWYNAYHLIFISNKFWCDTRQVLLFC